MPINTQLPPGTFPTPGPANRGGGLGGSAYVQPTYAPTAQTLGLGQYGQPQEKSGALAAILAQSQTDLAAAQADPTVVIPEGGSPPNTNPTTEPVPGAPPWWRAEWGPWPPGGMGAGGINLGGADFWNTMSQVDWGDPAAVQAWLDSIGYEGSVDDFLDPTDDGNGDGNGGEGPAVTGAEEWGATIPEGVGTYTPDIWGGNPNYFIVRTPDGRVIRATSEPEAVQLSGVPERWKGTPYDPGSETPEYATAWASTVPEGQGAYTPDPQSPGYFLVVTADGTLSRVEGLDAAKTAIGEPLQSQEDADLAARRAELERLGTISMDLDGDGIVSQAELYKAIGAT